MDDQLGLHAINMCALVCDHPVVPLRDRTLAFDSDDGVRRHLGRHRNCHQRLDEAVRRRHVIDARDFGMRRELHLIGVPLQEICADVEQIARGFHKTSHPVGEEVARLVAAPMGGADEDHPPHEGQGLDNQALLQQLPTRVTQLELLERDRADIVPELRAGIDTIIFTNKPPWL